MNGWLRKLFQPKESPSIKQDKGEKMTKTSTVSSVSKSSSSSSQSSSSLLSSSSPRTTSSQPPSVLSSRPRLSRKYDVLVCHSCVESDSEEAGRLVSFLETSHCSFRCFLRERDDCPGSAVSTELCQAVKDSHLWALLITPSFLQDEWCKYMMHQVLAEAPMSNRIIPLLYNLHRSQYPLELKSCIYIDLSYNASLGYSRLSRTVLHYLEELVKKEKTFGCDLESSSSKSHQDSSREDNQMSKQDVPETSVQLGDIKKNNGSLTDVCCDNH